MINKWNGVKELKEEGKMLKKYGFKKVGHRMWVLEDYENNTFIEIIGNSIRIDESDRGGKSIIYVICDNNTEVNIVIEMYLEEGELPNTAVVVME